MQAGSDEDHQCLSEHGLPASEMSQIDVQTLAKGAQWSTVGAYKRHSTFCVGYATRKVMHMSLPQTHMLHCGQHCVSMRAAALL